MSLKITNLQAQQGMFFLEPCSFEFDKGLIVGVFGLNASGKSSFLQAIAYNHRNRVVLGNRSLRVDEMSYLPHPDEEALKIPLLTIVSMTQRAFSKKWREDVFQDLVKKYQIPLSGTFGSLSLGLRQRFILALNLSHQAEVLLFDEPTEGVDNLSRTDIVDDIQSYVLDHEAIAIISTHDYETVERRCDRILVFADGRCILDTTSDYLREDIQHIAGRPLSLKAFVEEVGKGDIR